LELFEDHSTLPKIQIQFQVETELLLKNVIQFFALKATQIQIANRQFYQSQTKVKGRRKINEALTPRSVLAQI